MTKVNKKRVAFICIVCLLIVFVNQKSLKAMIVDGGAVNQGGAMGLYIDGSSETVSVLDNQGAIAFGIDVSYYQGTINWEKVAPNIDFAIIRCGFGDDLKNQDDLKWKYNVDECVRLGIPFGVYLYSYALTDAQAVSEAEHVLRLVSGYNPQLPIYLDLEDEDILNHCSNADILRHTKIFCERIEQAGYKAGVYANYNWWTNYLTSSEYDQWDRWIARYANSPGYSGKYSIWQYTSTGRVEGISGDVDLNYAYGDFLPEPELHVHVYESFISESPTCTHTGTMMYLCACGDSYTESITVKNHTYISEVIHPDCISPGMTKHRCNVCGDEYITDEKTALGHNYVDGACTRCGLEDEKILLGDLDGDGTITSADSVMLSRFLAGIIELTDIQKVKADLDGDKDISSADAVLLVRYLAGQVSDF